MAHQRSTTVVAVGVDDTFEGAAAAEFAATMVRERTWDLLVAHAYRLPPSTDGLTVNDLEHHRAAAESLVDDVLARMRLGRTTQIRRRIMPASPVRLLRDVSDTVAMLVLGRHHFDLHSQLLTGRIGSLVAAHATCPFVVVPAGWDRTDTSRRPVVVALDVEQSATDALRCAFEEAEHRQVTLIALHTIPRHGELSYLSEEWASLDEVIAGAKQDFPDVTVETVLLAGDPRTHIVEASITAGLVVVGRPHQRHGVGSWSHSVARALIERTVCPLLIAPETSLEWPAFRRATPTDVDQDRVNATFRAPVPAASPKTR